MKTYLAALCVALLAAFALSGCGGDNATNSSVTKEMTAAEQRQALVDKLKAAAEANDGDAVAGMFLEDERENAKKISDEMNQNKEAGVKVKVLSTKIEEKDGKFVAMLEQEIAMGDAKETDTQTLAMIEKDGNWYFSFKK
jgi:outer membrane PBP1 activator LpoA protein